MFRVERSKKKKKNHIYINNIFLSFFFFQKFDSWQYNNDQSRLHFNQKQIVPLVLRVIALKAHAIQRARALYLSVKKKTKQIQNKPYISTKHTTNWSDIYVCIR